MSRHTENEATLRRLLLGDDTFVEILHAVRDLDLPEAVVGAGAVRDVVWDTLSGRGGPVDFRDVDVAYFDVADLSPETEKRVEERLAGRLAGHRWDVKNQAAVHLWYEQRFGLPVEPLHTLEAAVATWPETATAIAVRLELDGRLSVIAPFGLEDLLGLVWRHNPTRATRAAYLQRLDEKQPRRRWPRARVVDG
jgi:uncharacterized protein